MLDNLSHEGPNSFNILYVGAKCHAKVWVLVFVVNVSGFGAGLC